MRAWSLVITVGLAVITGTPVLSQNCFCGGAGYTPPSPIPAAPGQLLTVFVHGVGAG